VFLGPPAFREFHPTNRNLRKRKCNRQIGEFSLDFATHSDYKAKARRMYRPFATLATRCTIQLNTQRAEKGMQEERMYRPRAVI
jgi:hypothetical protein